MFGITKNAPIIFGGIEWYSHDDNTRLHALIPSVGSATVVLEDQGQMHDQGYDWWFWVRFDCFALTGVLRQDASGFASTRDEAMQAALNAKQVFIADVSRLAAEFGELKEMS